MARMGQRTGAYRIFVGKSERKRPLGMSGRRWKDNINKKCKGIELEESLNCIELAQYRDKWQDNDSSDCIKCGQFLE